MNEQQTTSPGQRPWLSLFLDFSEQPCLLVGGGVIAARKLERLLAANARITLVAPQLAPATAALIGDGRIVFHQRPYQASDLDGHKLVVAATDDAAVNQAIAQAAGALAIPVNVATPGGLSTR